jgi:hypothetical protein
MQQMQNEWKRMFGTPQNPKRPSVSRVRVVEDPWVREFGEPAPALPKKSASRAKAGGGSARGKGTQAPKGKAPRRGGRTTRPVGVLIPRVEARMRRYKAMRTANTTARQLMEIHGIGRAEVNAEALRLRRRMPDVPYGVRQSLAVNALVKRRKASAKTSPAKPGWPFMEALLQQQQAGQWASGVKSPRQSPAVNALVKRKASPKTSPAKPGWPFMEALLQQQAAQAAQAAPAQPRAKSPSRVTPKASNSGRNVRRNRVRALIREHGLTKPQVNARKRVLRGRYTFPDDLNYTELAVRELARRR